MTEEQMDEIEAGLIKRQLARETQQRKQQDNAVLFQAELRELLTRRGARIVGEMKFEFGEAAGGK